MLDIETKFLAHVSEDHREQTVKEHSENVAQIAEIFAEVFGLGRIAYLAGTFHDLGKYSFEFQKRLLHKGERVDHSSAGAIEASKYYGDFWGRVLAYVISGHHSGLLDYGSPEHGLISRLNKGSMLCDYSSFASEITMETEEPDMTPVAEICKDGRVNLGFRLSFMIRMLYSALVDADFLDTERFMSAEQADLRRQYDDFSVLKRSFDEYMEKIRIRSDASEINRLRNEIFRCCAEAGKGDGGFYSLTVPTGGGKTLSSMAFALEQRKDRIIYVIPYTSIIQQTAAIFKTIFGDRNVLEHHSNFDFYTENGFDYERARSMRLSSENWDIPITVTTNVQFFESLFANKSSGCRKLHHFANSTIILDEAQMLPLFYLKPCLLALEELVKRYHATVVFCTATKPEFPEGLLSVEVKEIMPDPDALYRAFRRTDIRFIGVKKNEDILSEIEKQESCLCVVNTKKHAAQLFRNLDKKDKFHLSGSMCHAHRDLVLSEVISRLKRHEPCTLISTQLIECGVDISFPVVYRSVAGLDSVVQSAGRCNRENELSKQGKRGEVYVFDPGEECRLNGFQQVVADIGKTVMMKTEDIGGLDTIERYFRKLYSTEKHRLDDKNILRYFEEAPQHLAFDFESAAKEFRLIENTENLVIPFDEHAVELMDAFRKTERKSLLRKMQAYIVNVYPYQIENLQKSGGVERISENLWYLRTKDGFYDPDTGLMNEEKMDIMIF